MRQFFVFIFFFLFVFQLYSSEKMKKNNDYVLFNFSKNMRKKSTGWSDRTKAYDIYRWGRSQGLFLVDDKAPLIDKYAVFVSPYGAEFEIKNLNKFKDYILWIDFVRYNGDKSKISSRLKIFADGRNITEIIFKDLLSEGLYKIVIPRDLIYDGSVKIRMEEFAEKTGYWGIWDMIVSSEKLPDNIKRTMKTKEKRKLKIKEKLSQKKKTKSKNATKPKKLSPVKSKSKPQGGDKKVIPDDANSKNSIIKPEIKKKKVKLDKVPESVKKKIEYLSKSISEKKNSKNKKQKKSSFPEPIEPKEPKIN